MINFFKNKTILITGHTGFKGSWLSILLKELGANVIGYSLDINTNKDNYVLSNISNQITDLRGDILDLCSLKKAFDTYSPDIVFHLAAQPLVLESYKDPINTYNTNVIGTLHVLECIKNINKKSVGVIITTDKCYKNKEEFYAYKEDDILGGYDPYSSSKACCEILVDSYRNSFFNIDSYDIHKKAICTARAGNVIGGGDWSENRLIPDFINAIEKDQNLIIRNPNSIRPWQHVIEPLCGYLILAQKLYTDPLKYSGAYNFGPDAGQLKTVKEVISLLNKFSNKKLNIDIVHNDLHESKLLLLDSAKSKDLLSWKPILTIHDAIKWTSDWYNDYKYKTVYDICKSQIYKYLDLIDYL